MTSQISATAYERRLRSFQERAACGVYRIRLDNIELPQIPHNRLQNVTRLKKIFLIQKCLRYHRKNYIAATISPDVLHHRSSTVQASDGLNELLLRAEDGVRCLHGSCRIEAAKSVLKGQDRWWTVVLYLEDLDTRASDDIHNAFENQLAPSDGTIYMNLQKSLRDNHSAEADQWRAYLTTDKRRYFRQLCRSHAGIIDAFNQLLNMEPLFLGKGAFHIGVFHKLGSLHCDENLTNYLESVRFFWSTLSENGTHDINVGFIEALQGRCPRFSRRDHEALQKSLEADGVLGHLPRHAREKIYETTDWKYIQICCEVLSGLLAVEDRARRDSLKSRFEVLFHQPQPMVIQTSHALFQTFLIQDRSECFQLAYWQLWLCAMRLWPFLLVRRGQKCLNSEDERFHSAPRKEYWSLIAQNARRLGFDSSHLRSLSSHELPESLSDMPQYEGLTGDIDDSVCERYGTPFNDKYILDRNSLFLPRLVVDPSELQGIGTSEDVTTLFVRRSFFLRIFSGCKIPPMDPSVASQRSASPNSQARRASITMESPPELQPSTSHHLADTPANQDVTHQSPQASPEPVGGYHVDVWTGARAFRKIHRSTKDLWRKDLSNLVKRKFTLWEPDAMVGINFEELDFYPKTRIIAVPQGFDIDRYRRARGMGVG
ncbi:hypothetical protein LTS13_006409 [Exophiala xenobiotica]|nr:hypothetical protein LTS06_008046 [Exophiala xenobiotica]KAK5283508.1 hypothetical protein LTR40_001651 [Exophiala xenobiotica]KAK5371032.1 hypothetical protein LTS13_006409 [Exophiala xenobiotica]KAK5409150.1 hypothetical protein LTR90_009273 [Exophiala xenobiotica]KAK5518850.1 hypothetical protein LTR07_005820 [Exophiala xenobiotica]